MKVRCISFFGYLSLCVRHRDSSSMKGLSGDACSIANWTSDLILVTLDYLTRVRVSTIYSQTSRVME